MREPTNNTDYDAQYEHIVHWLTTKGAPSHVLGYAANLYSNAEKVENLTILIRQFIARLKGYDDPSPSIVNRALSYLKKHNLAGVSLRDQ